MNTPFTTGFGARLDQKYPAMNTRQRRKRTASGEGSDPVREYCFSEFSAIFGRAFCAFHDTNPDTLSRRGEKGGWLSGRNHRATPYPTSPPSAFASGSVRMAHRVAPYSPGASVIASDELVGVERAFDGGASDYPTAAREPSTPAGVSIEAACSFKIAREMTSF